MGIIISTEKELKWIETEHRRREFYYTITVVNFLLMLYAFFMLMNPENIFDLIYGITFLFAFLSFAISVLILTKSRRYLKIIDTLLEERRK